MSSGKLNPALLLLVLCAGCATIHTKTPAKSPSVPAFSAPQASKVVLILFENKNADDVLAQSFFGKLANEGAYFEQYYALTHPSQPNYVALVSGSTDGVRGDADARLDRLHLGQRLSQKGKSWKSYADAYPSRPDAPCDLRSRIGTYARKHEPFLSFADVQDSRTCEHLATFEDFLADAKAHRLPDFSLVIPDMNHDAHDQPIGFADTWLREQLTPLLEDPELKRDVILIVTFDEDASKLRRSGNRIYTVFWGDSVIPGRRVKEVYDHYDLLRTLEAIFQVEPMTEHDKAARPIGGIWR